MQDGFGSVQEVLDFSSITWASWPLAFTFMAMHVVAWAVTVVTLTRFVAAPVEEKR